ncbi:MAG: RNA polymerase sigma-70 factor (ECF subfamily) [Saprospiraceae bacterium]|jgi:RNA polymerase sigma-70 factor (ECF subfamily)
MFSNLQISRTLVKNDILMDKSNKIVSSESMQEEWVQIRAAQANPAAFRSLYDKYFEAIFRFIYRRTADQDLSGDICSQVFLKAMQKLHGYQFRGVPFSAWLYRIAANEVAQYYREEKKNRVVSIETAQLSDLIDEIEHADNHHLRKAMITAIDDLKKEDIQLIEMRFFEQRPFKEIAEIIGITESNAKVKTYRILEKLKKKIIQITKQGGRAPEM